MKRLLGLTLSLFLISGCGGDKKAAARIDELQTKVDDLTRRIKTSEDDLLAANKKLIAHQQVLQQMNERVRGMEEKFSKLEYGQSLAR